MTVDLSQYDLSYSLRRYYVDEFHLRHVPTLRAGSHVLDLGGNKFCKRGRFDIEQYPLCVRYVNLSIAKRPDVQADAAHVPFGDSCVDAVICSELLEHVPVPPIVLREVYRVLREGGTLLICVPFLYRIHGDPYDYGRYTDYYWMETLTGIGFRDIQIEKQGLFWSVLMDMLRGFAYQKAREGVPRSARMRREVARLIQLGQRKALVWDQRPTNARDSFVSSFTTGFGIQGIKG